MIDDNNNKIMMMMMMLMVMVMVMMTRRRRRMVAVMVVLVVLVVLVMVMMIMTMTMTMTMTMMMMMLMLMLLIPPCTFWPAGPLLGVSPLNRARGPRGPELAVSLPYGSSLLSEGERGRRPCRRTPHQKPLRFTVFFAVPIFRILWLKMGQHGPT